MGRCHSLILIDGCVYSCGMGRDGRLGHDSQADSLKPKKVFLGDRYCVDVSAGSNHSVVCTKREVRVCIASH
ncbi:unnamed protein product [Anisakis simplex]|uniref:Uncharacterized protein n=1 Tax=Anisakis simplex TaxID=6269 RepID=A0A3P6NVM7_ANISI|nr:unnamed protein product [Anisakis simplex]